MMLTEQEARKMFCPTGITTCERCLASRCMAWRWGPSLRAEPSPTLNDIYPGSFSSLRPPQPPTHGYCGLAGKP